MKLSNVLGVLILGTAPLVLANCGTEADNSTPMTAGTGGGAGAANAAAGAMSAGGPTAGTAATGGAGTAGSLGASGSPTAGGATAGGSGGGSGGNGGSGGTGGMGTAGQGGTSNGGAAGSGQGGGSFTLTSSKLAAGSMYSADFTCAGDNHSPPLTWSGAPAGTLSYAMVLKDTSNMMVHWVMWDIPPATTQLSEDTPIGAEPTMPAGAKQRAGFGNVQGYQGPCPNGTSHTYVFTLYAMDAATLPGVTTTTAAADLVTAIMGHDLASATLTAASDAKRP